MDTPQQSPNIFARVRDRRATAALTVMPMTARMLVQLGFYPNHTIASRRLRRLKKLRKVKRVGLVQIYASGPPEHLWSTRNGKDDLAQHNAELSLFLLWFFGKCAIVTGWEVDRDILPDATITYPNDVAVHVENDRGTMFYDKIVTTRWPKYSGKETCLWLCSDQTHKAEFMSRRIKYLAKIGLSHDFMLFALLEDAVNTPFEPIWTVRRDGQWVQKTLPTP